MSEEQATRVRQGSAVPPVPVVPESLLLRPFRGSTAVRSGLLSSRRLAGNTWQQLFHDVYAHRSLTVTHVLRAEAAAVLLPTAVITGCSAAVLWGVALARPEDDVELTLPPGTHQVRINGIVARRARLAKTDVWTRHGIPVSTPAATALRLASVLPRDRAVAAVDQLIHTGVVDLNRILELAAAARGPGSARARDVAALADGLAESPQETRLRLLIGRSGLPMPAAQFIVTDANGRFVARVDFAWPEYRLALEYDGLWHAESGQFAKDRQRLNRLQAAGWRVTFVTAADLHDPERLVPRIAQALAASPVRGYARISGRR